MPTKKTTKKKAVKKTTKKKAVFNVSAKVLGRTYNSKGSTILEALDKLKINAVAGHVIMTVSGDKGEKERVLPIVKSRRLFLSNGMTREVALKQTSLLFEGV